ncbi:MAG: VCBS repeat-containing protein [Pirellulaceae bacterium]|nr:VCBS repeat-containing protein [Pirellulaceae bacterium]
MKSSDPSARRRRVAGILVVAVLTAIILLAWRTFTSPPGDGQAVAPPIASDQVTAAFYASLAALDVEENQRAAGWLEQAVASEPREPALWANLALARLRLRESQGADEALRQALALAGDLRELKLLRAEILQDAGHVEEAIVQLRELHQIWPENVGATWFLVSLLGNLRTAEAQDESLLLLADILGRAPGNLRALCEQARAAAALENGNLLRTSLDALQLQSADWPEEIRQQLAQAVTAAQDNSYQDAARGLTFFENLLKPRPEYQRSLAQLGISSTAAIGSPLRHFVKFQPPPPAAAEPDVRMSFELKPFASATRPPTTATAVVLPEGRPPAMLALSAGGLTVGDSQKLPFPGAAAETSPTSIASGDLNFDFQPDLILAGNEGCRIFLGSPEGSFTAHEVSGGEFARPWHSVWTVDVDADGDLDLLLSDHRGALRYLQNRGDLAFAPIEPFVSAEAVVQLVALDYDGDGDVDLATLSANGKLNVWRNERSGEYTAAGSPEDGACWGLAVGDVDRDGRFELVAWCQWGELRQLSWRDDGTWSARALGTWNPDAPLPSSASDAFLAVADLDNNGAVDLLASTAGGETAAGGTAGETAIWLQDAGGQWHPLPKPQQPALRVASVADVDGDGLLDLVGWTAELASVAYNRSQAGYGWCVVEPTANPAPGDRRINSFGLGGRIEMRAGDLVQAAMIDSPQVHFGLGRRERAEVARIVWPNGTVQAEFELQARQSIAAQQRLKGSCPWVFTFDGQKFQFVKDFIWRSPLGLRINAQTTAGVTQTEDWIKLAAEQMVPRGDRHPIRITAELWETHFFDHVALLAVDHPADVEVLIDERFVPNQPPAQQVILATAPRPLENPTDPTGKPLNDLLREADGTYADTFHLGAYQGVAQPHWVEFDVPSEILPDEAWLIVGQGWVYPTDSSINVALGQGQQARPYGLLLEQQDPRGQWQVVLDNLGFPAGKNKGVVIRVPVDALQPEGRCRLRTNLEVYWDQLGWARELPAVEPRIARLPLAVAELRERGYSRLFPTDRRRPDTPHYEVESREPRWLDLEGYYTRFGDVSELLAATDDRYVIMNAGDELALEFTVLPPVESGWRRDFVLIGDGWVKDGDFNTAFSRTVQPLPAHDDPDYAGPAGPLAEDPVYRRHAADWQQYHTRYVTPRRFHQGLWPASAARAGGPTQP